METETTTVSALQRMLVECEGDPDRISDRISAVLEFLTLRAVNDAPYSISTDNEDAIVVFAAEDEARALAALLPAHYKKWDDDVVP